MQFKDAFVFHWTANGDFYFSDGSDLLRISTDGTRKATLLSDPGAQMIGARSCSDGRHVAVEWGSHAGSNKVNVWRMSPDGLNLKQPTHGAADIAATCAPDGKWVYYEDLVSFQILRVPMEGGTPEIIPGTNIPGAIFAIPGLAISPDGKQLAFLATRLELNNSIEKIALVPLAGPKPAARLLDPRPTSSAKSPIHAGQKGHGVSHSRKRRGQLVAPDTRWLTRPPDHKFSSRYDPGFPVLPRQQNAWRFPPAHRI